MDCEDTVTEIAQSQQKPPRSPTVELLVLATPIILMALSRMLMGFIDVIMVARLGTDELAAISPASMLIFVLGCLGLGIANAVQTFVSQADGRGEPEQAGGYTWQSFYIAGAFGVLTIPLVLLVPQWLGWIAALGEHAPAVKALEVQYVRIALWSIPPAIVCIGINGFFMGVQKPKVALVAVIASLAVNVVGNWLLIFGNLGFPALGIEGAAYATVIAWIVRASVLTGAMLMPDFDRRYDTRHSYALQWPKFRGLLRVGVPTSLGWLVDIGSWSAFLIIIVPWYGKNAMAASNVAMQLMHLSFMPAMGIGIALCSQVGFAIGQGKPELAYLRARTAFTLSGIYMGLVGLVFWFAPEPLMYIFTQDAAVIEAGVLILFWVAIFQVFDAMAITYMNALRGAGDTRGPAILMGVCCIGIFFGGSALVARFAPGLGISGPWAVCTVFITVVGLVLLWRFQAGRWQHIKLFDDQEPASKPAEEVGVAPSAAEAADAAVAREPGEPEVDLAR